MTKQKTPHAAAAAAIRKELKKHNVPATVRSSSYAGGNSVTVNLTGDPMPGTIRRVEQFANQYQEGHFDGMSDCYEFSNDRPDLPQVRFVFVNVEYSEAMYQAAYEWLCAVQGDFEDMDPRANYEDVREAWAGSYRVCEWVGQTLRGMREGFWTDRKPRQRAA